MTSPPPRAAAGPLPSGSKSTASNSDAISVGASWPAVPELPETETIARDLDGAIGGATIETVKVIHRDVLREITPRSLVTRTVGATIVRCWRRAKLVVIDLSTGDRIVVQPRFTGAL